MTNLTLHAAIRTMCQRPFAFDPATIHRAESLDMISEGMAEGVLADAWKLSAKAEGHRQGLPPEPKDAPSPEKTALMGKVSAILATAPCPLTAKQIRGLTGADYPRILAVLTHLERDGRAVADRSERFMKWRAA